MIKSPAQKKGLITSATMIVVSLLLFYGFKLPVNGNSQFVLYILFIAGIVWVLLDFKKKTDAASFKAYFNEGFKCFIIVTLFMTLYTYLLHSFNPQILDAEMIRNNEQILKTGNRTAAEIVEHEKNFRGIYMPMMVGFNIFKYLILGTLVTVITGGLLSQNRQS